MKLAAAGPVGSQAAIEVRLQNGRSLLVAPGFDADHVRSLLAMASSLAYGRQRIIAFPLKSCHEEMMAFHFVRVRRTSRIPSCESLPAFDALEGCLRRRVDESTEAGKMQGEPH